MSTDNLPTLQSMVELSVACRMAGDIDPLFGKGLHHDRGFLMEQREIEQGRDRVFRGIEDDFIRLC